MPVCEKPVFYISYPHTFFLTIVPEKKTDLVWYPHANHHHTHRDGRLYQPAYPSFVAYCTQRWELSRPRAYQLMDASTVVSNLSTSGDTLLLTLGAGVGDPQTHKFWFWVRW